MEILQFMGTGLISSSNASLELSMHGKYMGGMNTKTLLWSEGVIIYVNHCVQYILRGNTARKYNNELHLRGVVELCCPL